VRIILLSPSRNVTHFVKRSVLEIFIPGDLFLGHEHNKHATSLKVRTSLRQGAVDRDTWLPPAGKRPCLTRDDKKSA
jgi:hypothetical protein